MSHTCDKLFNSVDPNKSKSKQLANSVRGLFVAIYRCAQAVPALQSPIKGKPFNDSLGMTSITQHIWQPRMWQSILFQPLWPARAPAAVCLSQSGLCCCVQHSAGSGCTVCPRAAHAITFLHHAGFWEMLKSPSFYGSGWVISQERKDRYFRQWGAALVTKASHIFQLSHFLIGKIKIAYLKEVLWKYLNVRCLGEEKGYL